MPQAGFTPIQTYNSPTAGHIPVNTDLYAGELAINTTDEKLYFKNTSGTVKLLASTAVFTTTGSGSYVLATSPTITGHPTIEGVTSTGATGTGKFVFDSAPTITGHPTIEGVTSTGATGTGKFVFDSAPTITGHPTIEGVTSTGATGTGKFVFDSAPTITGHPTIEGVTSTGATGTGKFVFDSAPTITGHPTIEGVTSTGATGTGKFVFDSAPTITGHPTIEGVTSTGATGTGKFVFDSSPTLSGVTLSDGTANGVVYLNSSKVLTSGSGLVFDSSGNLGLGVVPSANSLSVGLDLAGGAGIWGYSNQLELTANAYFSGSFKYKANGYATLYQMQNGQHQWNVAPSGTAGDAISFTQAMTLDASGNLIVGGTSNLAGARFIAEDTSQLNPQLGFRYTGVATYYWGVDVIGNAILSQDGNERLRISSSGNVMFTGPSGTGQTILYKDSTGGSLRIAGGSSGDNGSNITLGGSTSSSFGNLTIFRNGTTETARIDSSGNLGLGVVPSAWSTSYKVFQFGAVGSLWANATGSDIVLSSNYRYDGTPKYIANGYSTQYSQFLGQHTWHTAPSGTAGNAISFTQAMTLDASGNLLVGTTSVGNGGLLTVKGTISITNATPQGTVTDQAQTTTSVGTSATTIVTSVAPNLSSAAAAYILVYGSNNSTAFFFDVLVCIANSSAPTVLSSTTLGGSPATRTYTLSGGSLKLAMGATGYNVTTKSTGIGYPF